MDGGCVPDRGLAELYALWEFAAPLIPPVPVRPQGGGRRRIDDRAVLAAICDLTQAGCSWWKLPQAMFAVTRATAYCRFIEWTKAGLWPALHLVLRRLQRLVVFRTRASGRGDGPRDAGHRDAATRVTRIRDGGQHVGASSPATAALPSRVAVQAARPPVPLPAATSLKAAPDVARAGRCQACGHRRLAAS
ncbi:transposase [Phytohabitans kaempferiae]|uniref:Transposase n=1 Tax=Phytohabitans kaempferiae TaxID=1620943 RepID=A0ABV6MAD4_9ACTN